MVTLTPAQMAGLQEQDRAWVPKISRSLPDANIVDRCESCQLESANRQITATAMSLKGKKPDEYAPGFTSHPEPDLLKIHDPEKIWLLALPPGQRSRTTSVEKATAPTNTGSGRSSNGKHWKPAARTCHARGPWCSLAMNVGWTLH